MTPNAKMQSALIALARSRRTQRALAHAYLHRGAPIPTLRSSLGFVMSTTSVTSAEHDAPETGSSIAVLGVAVAEAVIYVVEELAPDEAPIVYRLFLRGPRQGHLVPIHAWYEQAADAAEIRARIAALAPTLAPLPAVTREAWMLSTRIVQRRAVRVVGQAAPIRKFALQLTIETVDGRATGPSGKTTVTAFLRAHAQLIEVLAIPGTTAVVARVAFVGIPSGPGLTKETVVLLTPAGVYD
jgi:hypothetical protein